MWSYSQHFFSTTPEMKTWTGCVEQFWISDVLIVESVHLCSNNHRHNDVMKIVSTACCESSVELKHLIYIYVYTDILYICMFDMNMMYMIHMLHTSIHI